MDRRNARVARISACILFFALATSALCEESEGAKALGLSLFVVSGLRSGEAHSFVYEKGYLRSKLDWPMQPVWFFGAGIDLTLPKGFWTSASAGASIPASSGLMVDSDYLNGPAESPLTHKSTHNGYLENGLDTRLEAGWTFAFPARVIPKGSLSMGPALGFRYLRHKWTGRDGYLQYPPNSPTPFPEWASSIPLARVYGTVLAYEQEIGILYPAFAATYNCTWGTSISLSFSLSPAIWATGLDNHLHPSKYNDYLDIMNGRINLDGKTYEGWYRDIGIELEQRLSRGVRLTASAAWTDIEGVRGTTTIRENTTGIVSRNDDWTAGTSWSAFSASIGIRSRLR